jgi:hypothetical protein
VIAADQERLRTVCRVLDDLSISYVMSVDAGAGSLLAQAALEGITFALVVLPSHESEGVAAGLTAVLVEAGVVLGRGIPTLVVAETPDSLPPALSAVPNTVASLDNADALRLQIRVFSRTTSLVSPGHSVIDAQAQPIVVDIDAERVALQEALAQPAATEDAFTQLAGTGRFERYVFDLFARLGAEVAMNTEVTDPQSESRYELDGVLAVRGSRGTAIVFVEVSRGQMTPSRLRDKSRQLWHKMRAGRPDFGLIVFTDGHGELPVMPAPLVIAMPIRQLLSELRDRSLYEILAGARNRAVHGV